MRKEKRVELVYYLRLFKKGDTEAVGNLVNVNSGGIMLIGDRLMPPGGRYALTMDLPAHFREKKQVEFEGEILWSNAPPGSPYYHTGIRFVALSDEDRELLGRLSREFRREEIGPNLSDELNPPEMTE